MRPHRVECEIVLPILARHALPSTWMDAEDQGHTRVAFTCPEPAPPRVPGPTLAATEATATNDSQARSRISSMRTTGAVPGSSRAALACARLIVGQAATDA